jgi:CO/xanthine dehydrogenase Mo-binding subunit
MSIGSSIPRKESWEKVTGTAKYNDDYIEPGLLHAKMVISPHTHAVIKSIDGTQALAAPGVRAVVTGKDYPVLTGSLLCDQPPIAVDKVRYCGEPVALVVAESEFEAAAAAHLVKVEYEVLPSVTSPTQALQPGAPLVHDKVESYKQQVGDLYPEPGTNIVTRTKIRKGDMRDGWAKCDCVVEGSFTLPQTDHLAMETRNARVKIMPSGQVMVYTSSQSPFSVRKLLSRTFGLEEGLVAVRVPFVGGGYGGKAPVQLELLAYMASKAVDGKMVRIANTREEDIMTSPVKLGLEATLRLGAMADGLFQAAEMVYHMDTGAYCDIGPRMSKSIAVDCSGPYYIPHIQCDALCIYTNHTYATSYRGFGHIAASFCIERMIEKLADKTGIDPMEIRVKNALRPGQLTPTQVVVTDSNTGCLPACLEKLKKSIRWDEGPFVEQGNNKVRAKGIGCFYKTSDSPTDAVSGAVITFNDDGSLNLNIGAVEIGPGMKTTAAQVLAEAMRMDVGRIHVNMQTDTQVSPEHWKTVASMTTFMVGRAVIRAAEDLIRQLLSLAATAMRCPPEDLTVGEEKVYLKDDPNIYISTRDLVHGFKYANGITVEGQIIGRGTYVMRHLTLLDRESGKGKPGPYWTLGAQAVEVEYDKTDCTYRLLWAATAIDAGRVINPRTAGGLIMGGMCMGLGVGSREVFHCNSEGGINNTSLRTYKLMHYGEQPRYIVDFIETPNVSGPYGARGLAEHGIIGMPAALVNALSRAAGVEIDQLPATSELIWRLKGDALP